MKSTTKNPRLSFDEREKKILTAAQDLFSEFGFRGTTTKEIAGRAGINEALLYRHYKTKEELYTATLYHVLSFKDEHVLPGFKPMLKKKLRPALLALAQAFINENRRRPQLYRMILFSGLEHHRLAQEFLGQNLMITDVLRDFFQAKIEQGEVRSGDTAMMAVTFMNLIHHYFLGVDIIKSKNFYKKTEKANLAFFVDLFIRGVTA